MTHDDRGFSQTRSLIDVVYRSGRLYGLGFGFLAGVVFTIAAIWLGWWLA